MAPGDAKILETRRPDPGIPDASILIERCANGDGAAFRQLYDLWAPRLRSVAIRITHRPCAAADATQDAFIQLWRHAARFDRSRGNGEAFLTTLVRYRALDIVRRLSREVAGYESAEAADESPDALAVLAASGESRDLRRCIKCLDCHRQRVIMMAFADGISHADVAHRLGQPLGTVKSTIRRSLLSLRACLVASPGPDATRASRSSHSWHL